MADLTEAQAALQVKIVGSDSAGLETNEVGASVGGDLRVQDSLNTSLVSGAISVTTTASEAKAGASRLVNRKAILITPTNGVIYWGSSAAVTTATGTPIFKNQSCPVAVTDNVPIYLVAASTVDVRIVEGS